MLADADLEQWSFLVHHDTYHLEAEDLTPQHAMLHDRLGATRPDEVGEHRSARVERRLGRQWIRLGPRERRAVDPPHRRWARESCGPTGEHARLRVRQKVKLVEGEPQGPQEGLAEGPRRLVLGQHPTGTVLHESGAAREALGPALRFAPLPAHQGAELGETKRLLLLVLYFFFPPRAP